MTDDDEAILSPYENLMEAAEASDPNDPEFERMIMEAWHKPNPDIVTLADGRKVSRKYYDPKIHGEAVFEHPLDRTEH